MLNRLIKLTDDRDIEFIEELIPVDGMKGLYIDNSIIVTTGLTEAEKTCVLAEELGHHETSAGMAIEPGISTDRQEVRARRWAHNELVPVYRLIDCYEECCRSKCEAADFLGVTEEFLDECLEHYKQIHGPYLTIGKYTIMFESLGVIKHM